MFGFIKKGLQKTAQAVRNIIPSAKEKIDKDTLEEILIESDVHYDLIEEILDKLPNSITKEKLQKVLLSIFNDFKSFEDKGDIKPEVILILGVNGAGKTTTIAKLANLYKNEGFSVLLGAGDTFRAAAIEQLKRWAEKLDVGIVYTKQGHDASAVVYDTIESAKAKHIEKVIIDTAGRLQTQSNLVNELKKIVRIASKASHGSPHQKILILDGTQGNTAIKQALAFNEMIGIDGVIITKLDGTAKGGAIFSIAKDLKLPILFIGVGEKMEDLIAFSPKEFVEGFLEPIFI